MDSVNMASIGKKSFFRKESMNNLKHNIKVYTMLAPNLIMLTALSIYPILWVLKYMLYEYDGVHPEKFVGLDNFIRVFTRDNQFWTSVLITFIYVAGKLLFTLPPAFILAYILCKKFKGSGVISAIIFSPTIMSASVMALIFYLIFNVYNGDINKYLLMLHLIKQPINWLGKDMALLTVLIVGTWGAIGNYMIYFMAGLQDIPKDVIESAEIDGVNRFQKLIYITVPMLGPVLQVILMLALVIAFQDMQSIMVLTEGGPFNSTKVMFLYVYEMYFPVSASASGVSHEFGYGAAVSLVSASIIAVVTFIYLRVSRKLDEIF